MAELNPLLKAYIQYGPDTIVSEVPGGLVHQVYRIQEGKRSFYIKVRGTSFLQIPELASNPNEIQFEQRALEIFSNSSPHVFPYVIAADSDIGVLVLSDLLPNGGEPLYQKICRGELTETDAKNIGYTLGSVHSATYHLQEPIRGNDAEFFSEILNFRLGFIQLPAVNELITQLKGKQNGLVMGGLSPKNILITTDGQVKFCDLETVCLGNRTFDIGYCLGYLLLHALPDRSKALALYKSYVGGYQSASTLHIDFVELVRLASATILYRTNHSLVSYRLSVDDETKTSISEVTIDFLQNWGKDINDLISAF